MEPWGAPGQVPVYHVATRTSASSKQCSFPASINTAGISSHLTPDCVHLNYLLTCHTPQLHATKAVDRIPPELHHRVCKYLSLTHLHSYRLVNKHFGSVGAANLFRQLVFHASFASVGRIHNIAAHPLLRQHVQSLVWDANMWALA
jgi:hypothetical protein